MQTQLEGLVHVEEHQRHLWVPCSILLWAWASGEHGRAAFCSSARSCSKGSRANRKTGALLWAARDVSVKGDVTCEHWCAMRRGAGQWCVVESSCMGNYSLIDAGNSVLCEYCSTLTSENVSSLVCVACKLLCFFFLGAKFEGGNLPGCAQWASAPSFRIKWMSGGLWTDIDVEKKNMHQCG